MKRASLTLTVIACAAALAGSAAAHDPDHAARSRVEGEPEHLYKGAHR